MKKILLIIIGFTLFGCSEDYLEKFPTTSMVIENFYKTPADATQAITAIYNTLANDDYWSYYILSEAASDNCAGGAGQGDGGGFQLWDRGIQQTNSATANQDPWAVYFGGIYRANIYLEYESRIDWTGSEALQRQYEAEARFLRAYFHFYLARMFGEIPIVDHALAPDELLARTPAEELYGFMLEDLKFCAEHGLSQPYGSMRSENWGRVTKWAAEAMIARLYLYYSGYYNDETLGEFTAADARASIDDVIANSNHELVPVFASLWRVPTISELGSIAEYAGEVNSEVVWAIRFDVSGNPFQWFTRMIGPRNTNIDPYGQGWGADPIMPTLWAAYEDGDSRKTATILSWDEEGLVYDWNSASNNQAQYTGYNSKKYELVSIGGTPESTGNWQQNGFEDYMIVRYADVLLMAAELHLLTNDNATALSYVNMVRERAFGDASHNLSSINIDGIFTERRLELACEGLRWSDILRSCKGDFSKLNAILDYNDETDGADNSTNADVFSLDVDGQNWADKKGLFQIPQAEIDLMDGIIQQNPGYTTE
jgi:starch-binding outer membrane protein, SusD/RagB family